MACRLGPGTRARSKPARGGSVRRGRILEQPSGKSNPATTRTIGVLRSASGPRSVYSAHLICAARGSASGASGAPDYFGREASRGVEHSQGSTAQSSFTLFIKPRGLPLASLRVHVSFVPKTGSGRSGALGHFSQLYLVHRQSQLVARRPKVPPATSYTFGLFSLNNIHF